MAMIAAGFTGGEAEELRRAFGFKRSEARMRDIEVKLRAGMQRNGITPEAQEEIIHSITSFALYGFPESHAASFALLAYASAYLKTHYLAAFTTALLNNQPMGFYSPATIVKDAQRHGLKIRPIDVMKSEWLCTVEQLAVEQSALSNQHSALRPSAAVRLGLRYVKGLREEAAHAIVRERAQRPFLSVDDLARRVPELRKNELVTLAQIGALNSVLGSQFSVLRKPDACCQLSVAIVEAKQDAEDLRASASGAVPTGLGFDISPSQYCRPGLYYSVDKATGADEVSNSAEAQYPKKFVARDSKPDLASSEHAYSVAEATGADEVSTSVETLSTEKPETGDSKLETRNPKLATGNWQLPTGPLHR